MPFILGKNETPTLLEELTPQEIKVLTWAAKGKTRAKISIEMSISEETVKYYLKRALQKLDATNTVNAVAIACALGRIQPYKKAQKNVASLKKTTQMGDGKRETDN